MAIYDGNGNIVPISGGGGFYSETDITVNMLSMPTGAVSQSNPEGFQTNTVDYRLIDYWAYDEDYITIVGNYSSNFYGHRLAFYDSSKNYISNVIYNGAVNQVTNSDYRAWVFEVPANTAYCRFQYRIDNNSYLRYAPIYMRSFDELEQFAWVDGYKFPIRSLLGIPNIDNSFVGKKVICLGDSITENNSHNNNKAWCEYLADVFGMFVYNNGKSGTGLVKGYQGYRPICNRVDLGSNDYPTTVTPDMVLIMANGNDATSGSFYDYSGNSATVTNEHGGASLPVGSKTDSASTLSVYGAMKHLFNSLTTKYPNAQIGFITSPPRKQDLSTWWGSDKANFYGHGAFDDYVTAIKWVCDEYNIPCLDLYHSTIFRPWNTTNCNTFYADGEIHPNTKGTIEGIVKPVIRWMMEEFF